MAAITKQEVETILRYKVVDKIRDYVPDGCKLLKMLASKEISPDGREYLEPVCLTLENGATYGDDTDFTYNDSVNGVYDEIQLESNPFVMQSRINLKAFNRLKKNEMAIGRRLAHRFVNLKKSTCKRAELAYWYGQSGLGRTETAKTAAGADVTIRMTPRTFAAGIWGGMQNAQFDIFADDNTSKLNTDPLTMKSVNVNNADTANVRKVVFTAKDGTEATSIAGNATSCFLYFRGAKDKNMIGIDKQIITQTGTMFGISKDTYELFRGNVFPCGNTWTMSKILQGLSGALAIGGLDEDISVWMHHDAFTDLNIDEAALRRYDKSYSGKSASRGNEGITFHYQGGSLTLKPHLYIKRGEAFAIPDRCFKRVGATDMEFLTDTNEEGKGDKTYMTKLEQNAAYQVLYGYDHHILIPDIVLCTKYTELIADS